MNPKQVLELAKRNGVVMVDLKFTDWPGLWQHFSVPISQLEESSFEDGFGFDGSSIRGWQAIHASDMLVIPDPTTAVMDPFCSEPTLSLICDIVDPITRENYTRDPRWIAKKAANYVKLSGIGDTIFFGPELEFFVFNSARFTTGPNIGYYEIDSIEGAWNTGRAEDWGKPNLAYKPRYKEGYFPVPPNDTQQDLRTEMVLEMQKLGIEIEAQHHEVATAGQAEIDMKFSPIVQMADKVLLYKYVVKNVARRHGLTATFMPKPIFKDNGSGMHCHQSIWKGGKPLFAGDRYAGLSDLGLWYIGGILKHARSLAAFTNPTVNSYHRLVPGYEAPVNLVYSARNRSAAVRIPITGSNPKAKRIEFRAPDPSSNPYLAFAALLMAGIDGIKNRIEPPAPVDKDLYELPPEEHAQIQQVPASLPEVLDRLEVDHDFLTEGGVFTPDLIEEWIDLKRTQEIDPLRFRPHPHEFELYYDC